MEKDTIENLHERLRLLDEVAAESFSKILSEKNDRIAELEKYYSSDVIYKSHYDKIYISLREKEEENKRLRDELDNALKAAQIGVAQCAQVQNALR
jgi:hypothetical protein